MYSFTLELLFSFFSWFQFLGNSPTLFILSFFLIYFVIFLSASSYIVLPSLGLLFCILCQQFISLDYVVVSCWLFILSLVMKHSEEEGFFLACSSVQHSVNLPNIAYRGTYYILLCMSWMRSLRFIYIVYRCANYSKFSFSLEKDTDRLGH